LREALPGNQQSDQPLIITVYQDMAKELPTMNTSPDMLAEAFRIIIKNAVEAIQENGRQAEIWLATCLIAPKLIEVRIRDSGVGIQPKHLKRIFELGWSTKQGQGMGFGLFWAKDYIEGLGGGIRVESVVGEGTTFIIRLPVA
jgi:signal transduction histidine kinase